MRNVVPRALCAVALMIGVVGGPVGAQAQVGIQPASQVKKPPAIIIDSYSYVVPKYVQAGARVRVVNQDGVPHSVTSSDGKSFSVPVNGGYTRRFTAPKKPGKYSFYCIYHSDMRGVLVVRK